MVCVGDARPGKRVGTGIQQDRDGPSSRVAVAVAVQLQLQELIQCIPYVRSCFWEEVGEGEGGIGSGEWGVGKILPCRYTFCDERRVGGWCQSHGMRLIIQ